MNPNNPDPNNPSNPAQPVQADLSSIIPPTQDTTTPSSPASNPTPITPPQHDLNTEPAPIVEQPTYPDPNPIWSPPETPTMPTWNPEPIPNSQPTPTNPLDNPLNVPTTSPTIDGGLPPVEQPSIQPAPQAANSLDNAWPSQETAPLPQPTFTPPEPAPMSTTPSLSPQDIYGSAPLPTQEPSLIESAPTDLSHLIPTQQETTEDTTPTYAAPVTQPETLIVPPGNETTPNIPTENESGKLPKWVIGVGVALFLAVVAASGYLILGIGQNQNSGAASIPATQQTTQPVLVTPTNAPIPITSPVPATSSAGFGQISGGTPAPIATSAADLIRQRQQTP